VINGRERMILVDCWMEVGTPGPVTTIVNGFKGTEYIYKNLTLTTIEANIHFATSLHRRVHPGREVDDTTTLGRNVILWQTARDTIIDALPIGDED
jgi:hypothetical protein